MDENNESFDRKRARRSCSEEYLRVKTKYDSRTGPQFMISMFATLQEAGGHGKCVHEELLLGRPGLPWDEVKRLIGCGGG